MNHPITLPFLRLCRGILPALLLWTFAVQSHATPVFEPVQGFVRSPENPQAKLIQGSDGNFYGTTYSGGLIGCGTVFKMTPTGTLTTLVNFNGANGSNPSDSVVQGSDGNFYGTTLSGGSYGGSAGYGTVFKMTSTGTLTTLVNFTGANGCSPQTGLVQGSDGNFYGTTAGGGFGYYDTVFKMTPAGTLTTLVNFTGANGRTPLAGLVQGSDGNFYGTTQYGGSGDYGTVFKMTPAGTLTTLVNFTSTNGSSPYAGLIQGSDGNFYGTTIGGGSGGYGTVFKMTSTGTLSTLVNFTGANGLYPQAKLIQGSDGNFYGTTREGGGFNSNGTVFKMTSTGTLTTLVRFTGANGNYPLAGLARGSDGNFYGTTSEGGSSGYGTVFKMTSTGTLTTLVHFIATNGRTPLAGLVQGSDGNFYGTTAGGGSSGYGTVFKMTSTGTLTTLVNFTGANGNSPEAGLVQGSDGNFYGTTYQGGSNDYGTVFQMTSTGTLTTLVNFTGANGNSPQAGLVQGSDGNFYGTTSFGGSSGYGTVFKMTAAGTLSTLVNFTSSNGRLPHAALIQGSDGNFYGTTAYGGSSSFGTVFKMTAAGTLSTLVNFTSNNGGSPQAGLVQGSDGNFYGTTADGGSSGYGTVFKMTSTGTLTTLVNFAGATGSLPHAGLIQGSDGNFYGTTANGGSSGYGTAFQMTSTGTLSTLVNFTGANGSLPQAGLIQGSDGNFYGTTFGGGTTSDGQPAGGGQIFRLRMGPAVTSQPQTGVAANSATLNGTVNPGGYATPVSFQYGTDPALATPTSASAGTLPVGNADVAVQAVISGLAAKTTYYYRIVASNIENTVPQKGDILSFTTLAALPAIAVEQPLNTNLTDGGARNFGSVALGANLPLTFTIRNPGTADLTGLTISRDGADFTITATPVAPVPGPNGSTTFTVQFAPTTAGAKSAAIHIASNASGPNNPFDINLTGTGATAAVVFNNFIASHSSLSGAAALPAAIPFNDGVKNLLKYAFNMNPAGPDSHTLTPGTGAAGLPVSALTGTGAATELRLEFLRRKGSGLIYTPVYTTDLTHFTLLTGTTTVTSIDSEWERVVVRQPANPATSPTRFGRVEVTLP